VSDGPWCLADLHGAAVWVGETRVGWVSGIYADTTCERIVGFELSQPDGDRWFLPWVTCTLEADLIRCSSPLVFIRPDQLEFYVRHGATPLREEVRALWVESDGRVARPVDGYAAGVSVAAAEGISNL
jgi:hypothetical protein